MNVDKMFCLHVFVCKIVEIIKVFEMLAERERERDSLGYSEREREREIEKIAIHFILMRNKEFA